MDDNKKRLIADLIVGVILGILVIAVNWSREMELSRRLCDGFFVPAVVLLGLGGIKFVRNEGAFDVAGYGLINTVYTMLPMLRPEQYRHRDETMEEYRQRKEEKRRSAAPELRAGLVFLVLSVIMLVIYLIGA